MNINFVQTFTVKMSMRFIINRTFSRKISMVIIWLEDLTDKSP